MNHARLALQYGSNMPIRIALALASSFWAMGLVNIAVAGDMQIYSLMRGASPATWASVFAVNSAMLWWRIFDRRPRPRIGRWINALTGAMWLTITTATMADFGFLAAAGDLTLFLMSLWVALRTDMTSGDRETA